VVFATPPFPLATTITLGCEDIWNLPLEFCQGNDDFTSNLLYQDTRSYLYNFVTTYWIDYISLPGTSSQDPKSLLEKILQLLTRLNNYASSRNNLRLLPAKPIPYLNFTEMPILYCRTIPLVRSNCVFIHSLELWLTICVYREAQSTMRCAISSRAGQILVKNLVIKKMKTVNWGWISEQMGKLIQELMTLMET